jgi:hypothetical protein
MTATVNVTSTAKQVAQLNLAAGNYMVMLNLQILPLAASTPGQSSTVFDCDAHIGSTVTRINGGVVSLSLGSQAWAAFMPFTLTAPGTIAIFCASSGSGSVDVAPGQFTALRLTSLTAF